MTKPVTDEFELDPDSLPVVKNFKIDDFLPVTEEISRRETTISDLNVLNNHLGLCHAVLPFVKSVASLCALSVTVVKLIECRRKVKELPYGAPTGEVKEVRTF